MPSENRKRALVLSGGGGRGAYHIGVLRFLEEHEWFPDVVVGTSIGAVNGAALASGHNAHSLWALWQRLRTKDVQKPNLNPLQGNFLLDTEPLRETLQKRGWVHFERINSPEAAVHLRITATEVNSGRLRIFGNSNDIYPSKMRREPLTIDHIIASCSIPIVYPATRLYGSLYWDGATVANTPLGAAIDAGAEEIIVVLMTPWEEEADRTTEMPRNLLAAAGTTLEWALLASFQADLKMFRRINEIVRLQLENARLRRDNAVLRSRQTQEDASVEPVDENAADDYVELKDPLIVAPRRPIAVEQIISYTREEHERLYRLGYSDGKRAWRLAGREVEGEG